MRHSPIACALLVAMLALGGCVSARDVANMMVTAPNQQASSERPRLMAKAVKPLYAEQFMLAVGPPLARLSVAVLPPRNYGFYTSEKRKKNPERLILEWGIRGSASDKNDNGAKSDEVQELTFAQKMQMDHDDFAQAMPKLQVCRATGTVILLPGWDETKESLIGYALDLANHGYRVVLVDLRGQGQSSGDFVTYGLIEHRDISQLITALYQRRLVVGKLAVVGFSLGATIALDTAAKDKRIDAVVAVAPFVNLKKALRATANLYMPQISKAVSADEIERAFAIASYKLNRDLANTNPIARVGNIQAPVLYLAGGKDKIAPASDVKALAARTPDAKFLQIPEFGHFLMYTGAVVVAPHVLKALAGAMNPSPDAACLSAPPPQDAHYSFRLIVTLTHRDS